MNQEKFGKFKEKTAERYNSIMTPTLYADERTSKYIVGVAVQLGFMILNDPNVREKVKAIYSRVLSVPAFPTTLPEDSSLYETVVDTVREKLNDIENGIENIFAALFESIDEDPDETLTSKMDRFDDLTINNYGTALLWNKLNAFLLTHLNLTKELKTLLKFLTFLESEEGEKAVDEYEKGHVTFIPVEKKKKKKKKTVETPPELLVEPEPVTEIDYIIRFGENISAHDYYLRSTTVIDIFKGKTEKIKEIMPEITQHIDIEKHKKMLIRMIRKAAIKHFSSLVDCEIMETKSSPLKMYQNIDQLTHEMAKLKRQYFTMSQESWKKSFAEVQDKFLQLMRSARYLIFCSYILSLATNSRTRTLKIEDLPGYVGQIAYLYKELLRLSHFADRLDTSKERIRKMAEKEYGISTAREVKTKTGETVLTLF